MSVGNTLAAAPATIEPNETSLTFVVPRLGTSGGLTVVPPGPGAPYAVPSAFAVRSPRNTSGFQFDNPRWGNLSFGEITDLVGTEEMFLSTNPCWPLGDCTIALPIPDPVAYLKWQIIDQVVQGSGGHCFGINRTIQEIGAGRIAPSRFFPGASSAFTVPSPTGPVTSLGHYLDHRHAGQTTKEFLLIYGTRDDNIAAQLGRVRSELAARRLPGLVVKNGFTQGHVITAHDVEDLPDGTTVIHTYDNETQFVPEEDSDLTGATHRDREAAGEVRINPQRTRWDYVGGGWSGGNDGSFYATKLTDFPAGTAPTLPGVGDAIVGLFGSTDGAATTGPEPKGTEIVPALDRAAVPGAAGFVLPAEGTRSFTHVMEGRKRGTYTQSVMGNDFIGSAKDIATDKGVTDRLTGSPGSRTVRFAGEKTRSVTLEVGRSPPGAATSRRSTRRARRAGARRCRSPAGPHSPTRTTVPAPRSPSPSSALNAARPRPASTPVVCACRKGERIVREAVELAIDVDGAARDAPRRREALGAQVAQPGASGADACRDRSPEPDGNGDQADRRCQRDPAPRRAGDLAGGQHSDHPQEEDGRAAHVRRAAGEDRNPPLHLDAAPAGEGHRHGGGPGRRDRHRSPGRHATRHPQQTNATQVTASSVERLRSRS